MYDKMKDGRQPPHLFILLGKAEKPIRKLISVQQCKAVWIKIQMWVPFLAFMLVKHRKTEMGPSQARGHSCYDNTVNLADFKEQFVRVPETTL